MDAFPALIREVLTVTGAVMLVMVGVAYVRIWTAEWDAVRLRNHRFASCLLAAFLGLTPGCLGAFAVTGMYLSGALTRGALIAAMITTVGDEAFVMLVLMPKETALLAALLFALGISVGVGVDLWMGFGIQTVPTSRVKLERRFPVFCAVGSEKEGGASRKKAWAKRATLGLSVVVFFGAVASGALGPSGWNGARISLLSASVAALWIILTVSDSFLDACLWRHIVCGHLRRVFGWTLATLGAIHLFSESIEWGGALPSTPWILLIIVCTLGLIPSSGPHLIVVMLYVQGAIPLSVLFANSIVQDGHALLPLLAYSRRAFFTVKAVKFVFGLLVGAAAMWGGW